MDFFNLKRKVTHYKEVLQNTENYRKIWREGLRDQLKNTVQEIAKEAGLELEVNLREDLANLEAIEFSLGTVKSGMYQLVNDNIQRHLIKNNGSMIYQQLFNGKIIVMVNYPFIENYGKPRPPKTIGIYRPEEIQKPFCVRHLEEFIQEVTNWEDYDDDEPNKRIGFKLNFGLNEEEEDGQAIQNED